jgi:hypothetical protein
VGTVDSVVPAGYPAYARLLHPVDDSDGPPVRWADVATRTGRTVHPLVQWHRLVGSDDPFSARGAEVDDGPPGRGALPLADLDALLGVLSAHTVTSEDCWFGVWEGYGWVAKMPGSCAVSFSSGTFEDPESASLPELGAPGFTAEQLAGPRVLLPGRSYILMRGSLGSARFIGDQVTSDWFDPQAPNLCWPSDRAWFVGTEIDFDSTLVAGSRALIDELLVHPALEALEVRPGDSLTADADHVN